MASNLAGGVRIGQLDACLLRAAALDTDCTPLGGADSGIIATGLVTLTADPDVEEGTRTEPKDACGRTLYVVEKDDVVKRWTLSGEFGFFDYEMMKLLFGGTTILGASGGDYSGDVIGYADRHYTAARRNGVYLEVITEAVGEGAGECVAADSSRPAYIGHVFGKTKLRRGSIGFAEGAQMLTFSGTASSNPSLYNGPWNDYPGAGYAPNTAHFEVGYSAAEYDAMLALAGSGYKTLPVGS